MMELFDIAMAKKLGGGGGSGGSATLPEGAMVVKSKTFTEYPYQWLIENATKIIKIFFNDGMVGELKLTYRDFDELGVLLQLEIFLTDTLVNDGLIIGHICIDLTPEGALYTSGAYNIHTDGITFNPETEEPTVISTEDFLTEFPIAALYVD